MAFINTCIITILPTMWLHLYESYNNRVNYESNHAPKIFQLVLDSNIELLF